MTQNTIQLAVDGSHGIYAAKRFFELYPQFVDRLDADEELIMQDPEHEHHSDTWERFVNDFEVMVDGTRWYIWEDGDIFFVSENHDFEGNE